MRMDLARGREHHSPKATEAAEIDFMNIKQQGVDTGTGLLQSTPECTTVGLCMGGCMDYFLQNIKKSEIKLVFKQSNWLW